MVADNVFSVSTLATTETIKCARNHIFGPAKYTTDSKPKANQKKKTKQTTKRRKNKQKNTVIKQRLRPDYRMMIGVLSWLKQSLAHFLVLVVVTQFSLFYSPVHHSLK